MDLVLQEDGLPEIGFVLGQGLGMLYDETLETGALIGEAMGLAEGELTFNLYLGGGEEYLAVRVVSRVGDEAG